MPDLSDDQLVGMFAEGDTDAFDILFARLYPTVYNFARYMLHSVAGAEEVAQETFLAVARAAGSYEMRGRCRAWILGIARYRCLARIEAERTRRAVISSGGIELLDPPSLEPSPSQRAECGETAEAVRAAVLELPDRQREAIVLYSFEDMTYREIADALSTPVNTVKTLIHRARAAIARALMAADEEKSDAV